MDKILELDKLKSNLREVVSYLNSGNGVGVVAEMCNINEYTIWLFAANLLHQEKGSEIALGTSLLNRRGRRKSLPYNNRPVTRSKLLEEDEAQFILDCRDVISAEKLAKVFRQSPKAIYQIWQGHSWKFLIEDPSVFKTAKKKMGKDLTQTGEDLL